MRKLKILTILGLIVILSSCGDKNSFEIMDFNPISNYSTLSDTLNLNIDLSGAIVNGISIPSENNKENYFLIKFKIKNNSREPKRYYYKVYYQNESYKFLEFVTDENGEKQNNPKSNNNFYGSWNVENSEFHKSALIPNDDKFHEITDTIRIIGNPRNEEKYFGAEAQNFQLTRQGIENTMLRIQSEPEWMSQIEEKAKANNIPVSEQLYLDAKWIEQSERKKGNQNNRWKRNPRTGAYNFMLVVADKEDLSKIPYWCRDVTKRDSIENGYQNPFYYYLYNSEREENSQVFVSDKILKTKAKIDLSQGIYINPVNYVHETEFSGTDELCGFSDNLFFNAQIEQFFHTIDQNFKFENIPMAYNVVSDNYTKESYQFNADRFEKGELIYDFAQVTNSPGETIGYDSSKKAVYIINPGNINNSKLKKENVGIKTRHGFTYGKFRAKIKFPEILSKDNVWNGLTCAFWLLYQEGDWNMREICYSGYVPKHLSGKLSEKIASTTYSEIDIEIVKSSKHWPKSSYGNSKRYPVDDGLNSNVIIACTNWDLACHDPKHFNTGVKGINYKNRWFYLHRWDHWYHAVTSKYEYPQTSTLGSIFYYEIEWRPDKIIWRIGTDKNKMHVICYMDSTNTKIPDNQMISVITQEFHDASWWPTAPYNQNNIPFPKNDITGYIYEIEIE